MRWVCPWALLALTSCASPHVSISASGNLNEPDGKATVIVSRSDSVSRDVAVRLSYRGMIDDDYTGAKQTVTVQPGGATTIDLSAVDNKLHESLESLTVSIVPSDDYKIDGVGSVLISSADDDPDVPPIPTDAPWPSPGLTVLILRESQPSKPLPVAQKAIFNSVLMHDWLTKNCVKLADNQPGYRIWDDDPNPSNAPAVMQEAFKVVGAQTQGEAPMLGISNGKTGFVGPLPGTVEETLALLERYR